MARLRDAAAGVEDEEAPPDPATEGEQRHKLATAAVSPDHVVASLREGDLNRVEPSLALLANVDPARARRLLYGTDHRGLAALCARAGVAVPHYVALRMAFDLAERALENADPETAYASETIAVVVRQYDLIRREGPTTRCVSRPSAASVAGACSSRRFVCAVPAIHIAVDNFEGSMVSLL